MNKKPMPQSLPQASAIKPLLKALRGGRVRPVPFWLMRQAGRYLPEYRELRARAGDFLKFCFTPEFAAEATMQPVRRFGMDAAILFSDILVVPYALGQQLRFAEGEGPVLDPIRDQAGVAKLRAEPVDKKLEPVYEAIRLVRRKLDPSIALIGFSGGPWTLATYMVEGGTSQDFLAVRQWAYGDPQSFDRLMAPLMGAVAAHLIAQAQAGADVLQIFDTWAGILSETQIRRLVIGPTAEIVRRVKRAHPSVPIIGFPRGIGALYADYAREAGVDAVGLDSTVSVAWAAAEVQSLKPVQGNLDPVILLAGGEPLRAETERILEGFGAGPFVFNLGHGVLPQTPPEHVAELVRLIRRQPA